MRPDIFLETFEDIKNRKSWSPEELGVLNMLSSTIKDWALVLSFYADKHYDGGLMARRMLHKLNDADKRVAPEQDRQKRLHGIIK